MSPKKISRHLKSINLNPNSDEICPTNYPSLFLLKKKPFTALKDNINIFKKSLNSETLDSEMHLKKFTSGCKTHSLQCLLINRSSDFSKNSNYTPPILEVSESIPMNSDNLNITETIQKNVLNRTDTEKPLRSTNSTNLNVLKSLDKGSITSHTVHYPYTETDIIAKNEKLDIDSQLGFQQNDSEQCLISENDAEMVETSIHKNTVYSMPSNLDIDECSQNDGNLDKTNQYILSCFSDQKNIFNFFNSSTNKPKSNNRLTQVINREDCTSFRIDRNNFRMVLEKGISNLKGNEAVSLQNGDTLNTYLDRLVDQIFIDLNDFLQINKMPNNKTSTLEIQKFINFEIKSFYDNANNNINSLYRNDSKHVDWDYKNPIDLHLIFKKNHISATNVDLKSADNAQHIYSKANNHASSSSYILTENLRNELINLNILSTSIYESSSCFRNSNIQTSKIKSLLKDSKVESKPFQVTKKPESTISTNCLSKEKTKKSIWNKKVINYKAECRLVNKSRDHELMANKLKFVEEVKLICKKPPIHFYKFENFQQCHNKKFLPSLPEHLKSKSLNNFNINNNVLKFDHKNNDVNFLKNLPIKDCCNDSSTTSNTNHSNDSINDNHLTNSYQSIVKPIFANHLEAKISLEDAKTSDNKVKHNLGDVEKNDRETQSKFKEHIEAFDWISNISSSDGVKNHTIDVDIEDHKSFTPENMDNFKSATIKNTLTKKIITTAVDKFLKKILINKPKSSEETLTAALEDCYSRFILNLPHEYLLNRYQLYFAIQEAYWWYDDYWFESYSTILPKLSMRKFGFLLCEKCPLLKLYFDSQSYALFMAQWRQYCRTIPLRGAILINSNLNKVLMVQDWNGEQWMFPRGKVDEKEDDVSCAIREIREELGVDISKLINPNIFIESRIDGQPLKLYIIPGILESTPFCPRRRKEILNIRWISLSELPTKNRSERKLRFWNVHQFTEAIIGWAQLLEKGSTDRITTSIRDAIDLNSNWETLPDHMYSFASPPTGYNFLIGKRYSNQILKDSLPKLKTFPISITAKKLSITSLTTCQPAEPKPAPLPPYVDETKWFKIPKFISSSHLNQLKFPHKNLKEKILSKNSKLIDIQETSATLQQKKAASPFKKHKLKVFDKTCVSIKAISKMPTKSKTQLQDFDRLEKILSSDSKAFISSEVNTKLPTVSLFKIIQKFKDANKVSNKQMPPIVETTLFSKSRIETFIDRKGIAKTQFVRNETPLSTKIVSKRYNEKSKICNNVVKIHCHLNSNSYSFDDLASIQLEGPSVVRLGEKVNTTRGHLNSNQVTFSSESTESMASVKSDFDRENEENNFAQIMYTGLRKFNLCRSIFGLKPIEVNQFFDLLVLSSKNIS